MSKAPSAKSFKGLESLSQFKGKLPKTGTTGTKGDKFGRIENNCLFFNGEWYSINYVGDGAIFLNTQNKLFGDNGDEFPLSLIR
jgi:hypothetical protein